MNLEYLFIIFVKLLVVVLLSGFIGYERERIHRPAGLRTHIIVGIGTLLISVVSVDTFSDDPARLIAGIVTGMGFLGAGTIFRDHDAVRGLTTAASLWTTAGVAIAIALDHWEIGILGAIMTYAVLQLKNIKFFSPLFDTKDNTIKE